MASPPPVFRSPLPVGIVLLVSFACSTELQREHALDPDTKPDSPCPDEVWVDVSAGGGITCAVCATGKLACWGDRAGRDAEDTGVPYYGDLDPPNGEFAAVEVTKDFSVASATACALDPEGTPACWGRDNYGQASPPESQFTSLSLGDANTCGLDPAGEVVCWGLAIDHGAPVVPPGAGYTQLISNARLTCGLAENGDSTCWWPSSSGPADFFTKPGPWSRLAAVGQASCGVSSDGSVTCWEYASGDVFPLFEVYGMPTDQPVTDLCLLRYGGCALLPDGTATCFGPSASTPPDEEFVELTCGTLHACGLTADGRLECWGPDCEGPCAVP